MKTIKQSLIVESLTSSFTEKDISFDTLDDGYVGTNSIMLYTGKIDKDTFNKASQENCDFPRLFDRDCYYQVWVDLNNGKLRIFKISGYPERNTHSPDYLREKPHKSRPRKSPSQQDWDDREWLRRRTAARWLDHQKRYGKGA
tara:strand:- start:26 stop:454 length:429 start_codon:yes stop_codon:yes gene_type:complete